MPAHVPTPASRNYVSLACLTGFTQEQIAQAIGIAENTLTKHYRKELDDAGRKLLMAIAANLATIAQSPTHPKAPAAAMFWLKSKGGFSDKGDTKGSGDEPTEKITFTINIGGTGTGKQQLPGDTAKLING